MDIQQNSQKNTNRPSLAKGKRIKKEKKKRKYIPVLSKPKQQKKRSRISKLEKRKNFELKILIKLDQTKRRYQQFINKLPKKIQKYFKIDGPWMNPVFHQRICSAFFRRYKSLFYDDDDNINCIDEDSNVPDEFFRRKIMQYIQKSHFILPDQCWSSFSSESKGMILLMQKQIFLLKNILPFRPETLQQILNNFSKKKNISVENVFQFLHKKNSSIVGKQFTHLMEFMQIRPTDQAWNTNYGNHDIDSQLYIPYTQFFVRKRFKRIGIRQQNKKVSINYELKKLEQRFMKQVSQKRFFHSENPPKCPKCKVQIQQGCFKVKQKLIWGYHCLNGQNCDWFVQHPLPSNEMSYSQDQVLIQAKTTNEIFYKTVEPTHVENNLVTTIKQDHHAIYTQRSLYTPDMRKMIYTTVPRFTEEFSKQILRNRLNQSNLPLSIRKSTIKEAGNGMFATEKIQKDKIILTYVGLITFIDQVQPNDSMFQIGWIFNTKNPRLLAINPFKYRNSGRYINHSKKNNCQALMGVCQNQFVIVIHSNRQIKQGEQIFYRYGSNYNMNYQKSEQYQNFLKLKQLKCSQVKEEELKIEENAADIIIQYLKKQQLASLYRKFSRMKYNKYKHQFPRMRQSQLVSKVIKEWQALSSQEKTNLYRYYLGQKYFNDLGLIDDDDDSQSQKSAGSQQKPIQSIDKCAQIGIQKPTPKKSGVRVFSKYDDDNYLKDFYILNSQLMYTTHLKIQQLSKDFPITNARKQKIITQQMKKIPHEWYWQKIRHDQQKFINSYKRMLLNLTHDVGQNQKTIVQFNHFRPVTPVMNLQKLIGTASQWDEFHIWQKLSKIKAQKTTQIDLELSGQQQIGEKHQTKRLIEKVNMLKKRQNENISSEILFMNLMKGVCEQLRVDIEHSKIIEQYHQTFSDSNKHPQTLDDFYSQPIDQRSRNSKQLTIHFKCKICSKPVNKDKKTTHLKQNHSQTFWKKWLLINFLKQSYIFVHSQVKDQNFLACEIIQCIMHDSRDRKLKKYALQSNNYKNMRCFKLKKGVLTIFKQVQQQKDDIEQALIPQQNEEL